MVEAGEGFVAIDSLRSWRRARILSANDHDPRARRASDLLVLLASGLALFGFGIAADPPAGFERALVGFLDAIPSALDGLWQVAIDVAVVWTAVVVVVAFLRRRWTVVADLALAVVLAAAVSVLVGHVVLGDWPSAGTWTETRPDALWFPSTRLALVVAVLAAASPHLTRPARRMGRWLTITVVIATALVGGATPVGAIAGWLAGLLAASAVHLLLGSSSGRPGPIR